LEGVQNAAGSSTRLQRRKRLGTLCAARVDGDSSKARRGQSGRHVANRIVGHCNKQTMSERWQISDCNDFDV
jgi:hypothetical protein